MNAILKSLIIALVVTVVFIILHVIFMQVDKKLSMSHGGIFATVFVAAVLAPLLSELSGLNKRLCK
jgi:hypothetical protein